MGNRAIKTRVGNTITINLINDTFSLINSGKVTKVTGKVIYEDREKIVLRKIKNILGGVNIPTFKETFFKNDYAEGVEELRQLRAEKNDDNFNLLYNL